MKKFNKNSALSSIKIKQNKNTYIKRLSISLSCLFLILVVMLFTFAKYESSSSEYTLINGLVNYSSCAEVIGQTWAFDYTGNVQDFTASCNGYYKIELWGASGGSADGSFSIGLGGYTKGNILLSKDDKFYVYVGGAGQAINKAASGAGGGWNGGGDGINVYDTNNRAGGGGGATDIRYFTSEVSSADLAWNSVIGLNSRIMVAGGAGGASYYGNGGAGGGLEGIQDPSGYSQYNGTGGTQTSGGTVTNGGYGSSAGSFGVGGTGASIGGGGGAGYYGAAGGVRSRPHDGSGGGGSSYISGHAGSIAIAEGTSNNPRTIKSGCSSSANDIQCSKHYSDFYFVNTKMIDGLGYEWTTERAVSSSGMPTHDGTSTMTGNTGNGYAKITFLGNVPIEIGQTWTFDYTGNVQEFIPGYGGKYKVEVWAASGDSYNSTYRGGYGAYSVGTINAIANQSYYVVVGGAGNSYYGGYNGGGEAQNHSSDHCFGGGGATHIATVSGQLQDLEDYKGTLVNNSYYVSDDILIVAGAGGGACQFNNSTAGDGGGYEGRRVSSAQSAGYSVQGTQTAGGTSTNWSNTSDLNRNGGFGRGAMGPNYSGGGGAGFYGGGSSYSQWSVSGAGGSGYIASSKLASYSETIKSMYCYGCQESNNSELFTVSTIGSSNLRDTTNCPNGYSTDPISKCAKEGNGYAKITYVGQ